MPEAFYNEIDPHAAGWLRNLMGAGLISPGVVDERDISHVAADDVRPFRRAHFFAGISGWELALALAGWPVDRPVWTGSCPCQPYSAAGKGQGDADPRNLWPAWFPLIRECRPDVVFGEQVESAIGHGWLDGISADLEGEGYAVGAAVLGAHSVGAPHIRQRLYWVAYLCCEGLEERQEQPPRHQRPAVERGGLTGGLAHAGHVGSGCGYGRPSQQDEAERCFSGTDHPEGGLVGGMGDADRQRFSRRPERDFVKATDLGTSRGADLVRSSTWDDFDIVHCRDGKARRVESGTFPLVAGLPKGVVPGRDPGEPIDPDRTPEARVMRLKGYGNAIVPQLAAEFIRAFMETLDANQRQGQETTAIPGSNLQAGRAREAKRQGPRMGFG